MDDENSFSNTPMSKLVNNNINFLGLAPQLPKSATKSVRINESQISHDSNAKGKDINTSDINNSKKAHESQIPLNQKSIRETLEENLDDSIPSYVSEDAMKDSNEIIKRDTLPQSEKLILDGKLEQDNLSRNLEKFMTNSKSISKMVKEKAKLDQLNSKVTNDSKSSKNNNEVEVQPGSLNPINNQFMNRQNTKVKVTKNANDKSAMIEIEKLEDHNHNNLNKSNFKRKGYYQLPGIKNDRANLIGM